LVHQYLREGPIPLHLVFAAFVAALASATFGLVRNASAFLDNVLVEMTVIGTGVVITNIIIAGLQRGQRVQSAKPVLEHLAGNLSVIADTVARSVGWQSAELFEGISPTNLVDRLRVAKLQLSASRPSLAGQKPSILVSEDDIALVSVHLGTVREQAFLRLQELEPNMKLEPRLRELEAQVDAWKTRAYIDLRSQMGSLQSAAGLKNVELLLKALQELAFEALRPFAEP